MIGRLLSFWGGPFSGAMLVLGRVVKLEIFPNFRGEHKKYVSCQLPPPRIYLKKNDTPQLKGSKVEPPTNGPTVFSKKTVPGGQPSCEQESHGLLAFRRWLLLRRIAWATKRQSGASIPITSMVW